MKYAGPIHGKGLVFLAMLLIATYIVYKATEPMPGALPSRSPAPSARFR